MAAKPLTTKAAPWQAELDGIEALLLAGGLTFQDESALSEARQALRCAAEARWEKAGDHLDKAGALAPERAWPWVLRSAVSSGSGNWGAAKDALLEAIRREPSAGQFARLAKLYEYLGILPSAIAAASSAVKREPSAEHYALKAGLLFCWREHAGAARFYTLALSKEPANAALYFSRSQAFSSAGHLAEALADARSAARFSPGDPHLWAWEVELLIHDGRRRQARALIRDALEGSGRNGSRRALAYFFRGYERLVSRDFGAAARAFMLARGTGGGGALELKAEFYGTAAAVLKAGASVPDEARLLLAGLGVNPPYSASGEALRALATCDVLFNNIPGHENFELLRALCRDCRPLAYHQANDEERLCAEILREARRGSRVGFVTRGCATVYGPLGDRLLRKCRARRIACRDFPAVSSAEQSLARFGERGTPLLGMGIFDGSVSDFSGWAGRRISMTVYLDIKRGAERFRSLARRLAADYGGGHEVLVLDHVVGQEPLSVRARELSDLWSRLGPSAILYIPPIRS